MYAGFVVQDIEQFGELMRELELRHRRPGVAQPVHQEALQVDRDGLFRAREPLGTARWRIVQEDALQHLEHRRITGEKQGDTLFR